MAHRNRHVLYIPMALKEKTRNECLEMSRNERDMVILGQISSHRRRCECLHLYQAKSHEKKESTVEKDTVMYTG